MSRKHNVKHPERGRSRYPRRLKKRGFSKSPELEPLDVLIKRQERRLAETCSITGKHDHHVCGNDQHEDLVCNGQPWWSPRAEAIQRAAKLAEGPEAKLLRAIFENSDVA